MKEPKPYFYRIEAARFMTALREFRTDKELAAFTRQFAMDLVTGIPSTEFAASVISEANDFIEKKRTAGSSGGKQRASNAQALLKQRLDSALSKTQPNSSSSNNINLEEGGKPPSVESLIWKIGLQILIDAGIKDTSARTFLGKHVKTNKEQLANVISQIAVNNPIDPAAYIEKAMQPRKREVCL